MINKAMFNDLVNQLGPTAQADIEWSENCQPPQSADEFAAEAIFVICNSGMKNTVARKIYDKVMPLIWKGESSSKVFGHEGKCGAIDRIWRERARIFSEYIAQADDAQRVEYCSALPWIGDITKYHLAKSFGVQVAKPDVHLQRLADIEDTTVQSLCERLASETGYKIATVDVLLWRACANGIINSRTGQLSSALGPLFDNSPE